MKRVKAIKYLNTMMLSIQKARSILREGDDKLSVGDERFRNVLREIEVETNPYIFGKKCPLEVLIRILDNDGSSVTPNTFSNMMYIALRLEPVIGIVASLESEGDFPAEWSIDMVKPFEDAITKISPESI